MSFQPIVDRWRSSGRASDADRAETAIRAFRARQEQLFQNLDQDPEVSQGERENLLQQLILVDVSDGQLVADRVFGYARVHQCQGKRIATAQRAALGHVEERSRTEHTFASTALARLPLTRRRRHPGLFVDSLLAKDLPGQKSLLGGTLLSRWLMWSFYQPQSKNEPFEGVIKEKAELIRRLGLGRANRADDLLLWEHRLDDRQTAHRPNAFDAEAYDYFRPGGKTLPLNGADDGLHEIVHGPVTGDQLVAKIELVS